MSFQHVPTEILEQIFQYLQPQKHAIFNCSAVCKSWRAPASRLYYETITIDDDKFCYRLMNQTRENNFGIWVRKIIIEDDLQELSQKQHFQLMLYLPYLKVIDLEESDRRDYHLSLLSEMNNLEYLEHIAPGARGWTQSEFKLYLACAYNYRHSLKYLDLSLPNFFCNNNGQYGSIISYLQNFVNLAHLSIKNISSQGGGDPNLKMFDILQSHPNLVSFSLCNVYQEPADSNQLETKTTQRQLKKLKKFDVHVPNFTESQIDYVTSYFPTHLDRFKLSITKTTEPVKWLQKIGESSIAQFGKYLGFVKEVEIVVSDYVTCAEPLSTITSYKVITSYWSFINAIMGKRKQLKFHISVTVDDMKKVNKFKDYLRIKRNQKNMYISYPLDLEEVLAQLSGDASNAIYSIVPLSSSHHQQLTEDKVNSIEVNVNQYNLSADKCLDLLTSALTTYSKLNLIKLSCNVHTGKGYHIRFGSNIEDCNVETYHQSHQFFENEYSQVDRPTNTPSVDNLKYIYLRNTPLVTSSLKTISNLLPNTKILKLINCDIEKDKSHNVTIDIGGIHHLNKLVLDIGFLLSNNCEYIVIKVKQSTSNTYYKWKKTNNIKSNLIDFVPTDAKLLSNYSRYTSACVTGVTIKCQKIDEIDICLEKNTISAILSPNSV